MKSDESIIKWLSIILRYTHKHIRNNMEHLNISSGQHQYLLCLYHHNGISQEELSKKIGVDKGTTARAVKKLVEAGYITREIDKKDKRAFKLHTTEKAKEFKIEFMKLADEWELALLEDIPEEQKDMVREVVQIIGKKAIQQLTEEALHERT